MIADEDLDFREQNDAPRDEAEFDRSLLEELNEDLGPETFLLLLRQFVEDVGVRLEKLSALPSAAADPAATRALTHQLKGLFLQFGANTAMRDAAALEEATPGDAAEKLERLRRSGARALAHFEGLRGPI
ncbi:Hpt domain-containing protein [uncultured Rhodoblastus sp.]|uniref:Hpt domain-containing protein n=1 Tax=uncultured Rhodoblastus sp. TaxID=543037 RepID=UPI0025E53E92|nr:Hpt domain-containing protein [uncultured Rhodoblastus sp.]